MCRQRKLNPKKRWLCCIPKNGEDFEGEYQVSNGGGETSQDVLPSPSPVPSPIPNTENVKNRQRPTLLERFRYKLSEKRNLRTNQFPVHVPLELEFTRKNTCISLVRNDPMPVYTTLPGQCFEQEIEVLSEGSKPVLNKEIERPATRQMIRTPPLSLPSEERELEKIETVHAKPVTKKKKKKKKSAKSVAISEVIETPVEEISIKPEALNDDINIEDDSNVIAETSIIQAPEINSLCGEKKLHTEITSTQEEKKLYLEPTRPRTRYGWPDKRSEKRSRLFLVGETKTTHIEVVGEKKPEISRIKKIELEVKQFEESLKQSKDIESNTQRNTTKEIKIDSGNHGEIILDMAEEDEKDAIARARISPELPTSEQISKGMRRVSPPPEIEITVPPCMLEPSHVKFIEDGKEVTLETVLEESKNKTTKKKFRIPKRLKGLLKK